MGIAEVAEELFEFYLVSSKKRSGQCMSCICGGYWDGYGSG